MPCAAPGRSLSITSDSGMADRVLHIGVDGRELLGRPTGVGRYLREILDAWRADPLWPHRVTIVVPQAPPAAVVARHARIGWLVDPGHGAGTWWEQTRLPAAIRRIGADVLFAPAYTGPLRLSCPMVLTIHDLSYFAHPEWFAWREGLRRRWLTRAAARRAAAILADSEVGAGDIARTLDIPRERIHVVKLGAPRPPMATATGRGPIVLYVGSLFERRHIPDLIDGFAEAAATEARARLVVVGEDRSQGGLNPTTLAARRKIASRVEWLPYLSDDELSRRYATARVFAFLSTYEGFGLTPLEAMAFGVPVVVLDTPIAREVYGEAACYVRADSSEIGGALRRFLTDDALHADFVRRGLERVRAFSWTAAARAVRERLERVAGP
jgi:glycosyltransferase involved in cell wall biosynthesis